MKRIRSLGSISALLAAIMALVLGVGGTGLRPVKAEAADEARAAQQTEVASHVQPAHSTWMRLRINGQQIEGDTYQENRKGMIALLAFDQSVTTAREAGSGLATGRRQYQPLLIRKRIDKSSPLLMKALTENSVAEVRFDFFRPSPSGDGTEERFYEIGLRNAHVASVNIILDDATGEPMEEVTFVFQTISWTYVVGGVTHEDSWTQQR